jgi:hypothetical protein
VNQPQQQPQPKGIQYGENTLFLCLDDDHEYETARAYLKNYPGTKASLLREIPIARLTRDHVIIPIFRPRGVGDAADFESWQTERVGPREALKKASRETLAKAIVETRPLAMKDYWRAGAAQNTGIGNAFQMVSGQVVTLLLCNATTQAMSDAVEDKAQGGDPPSIQPSGLRVGHLKLGW